MLLSTNEAIKIIGCGKPTLSKYIKDGLISIFQTIKNRNYFLEDDIKPLIKIYKDATENIPNKHLSEAQIKEKNKPKNISFSGTKDIVVSSGKSNELDEIGHEVMRDALDQLKDLGLHTQVDNLVLRDYAHSYQLYAHFTDLGLQTDGVIYDSKGIIKISPYMALASLHQDKCDKYRNKLGLDPLSRQKLTTKEKKDNNDMGDLF